MKKILLVIFAMLFTTTVKVSAQDTYTEVFVEILKVSPYHYQNITVQLDNFKLILLELNKKILNDQSKSEELLNKYAETQMVSDFITALFVPTMKKQISETELREMLKALSTPEAKSYFAHDAVAQKRIEQEFKAIMIKFLLSEPTLKDFENGILNIQPVMIDASIPANYIATFDNFYNKEYNDNLLNIFWGIITASSNNNPKVAESLRIYIKANIRALCLNAYYDTITKEDMQWSINHQNKPLTKKYTDTILNVIGNLSNKEWIKAVYVNFIMRYTMWIMDQGVEINV